MVKYIAIILISSRMTSEISGYIEYNYPTEQNISKHNIKWMRLSLRCNNRLDVALVDPKLRLYITYFLPWNFPLH